jgi:hypothetical protein
MSLSASQAEYRLLYRALGYLCEPVHLEEFAPEDRYERRQLLLEQGYDKSSRSDNLIL